MALPKDYTPPASSSQFAKIQDGQNRFRVLSDIVIGWEAWKDNKPTRRPGAENTFKPEDADLDRNNRPSIKHFWAMVVYSYNDKAIKVLEITQKTVMAALFNLEESEDWGDMKGYDITITKTGKGTDTSYAVLGVPPKPLAPEIAELYEKNKDSIDLNKLFSGEYPVDATDETQVPF